MGMGMMKVATTAATALLVIAVIVTLGPAIGGTIEDATPTLGASSSWNSSYNTDLPTGGSFWADYFPFVGIVVIGLLAGVVIMMWSRM